MRLALALAPRRAHAAAIIAGVVALAAPGAARAAFVADSTVSIKSIAPSYGTGSYTGTIAVDNTGANSSTVRITLNNTTSNSYITSVGFSLPGSLASASLSTPGLNSAWRILGDSNYTNGSMFDTGYFGAFDIGAAVGSTWHTSGTASNGIAAGQSGTFEFTLSGPGANVTAAALMGYLSTNGSAGIGVRFRTAGDSTIGGKVLAQIVTSPPPPPPPPGVPAPPAVLLALAGVGCLLGRGAFRRKPAPAA
ncbi:hypothetical protein J0H58_20775 [bacterium]|nr:hypothetical protein [bacterium]